MSSAPVADEAVRVCPRHHLVLEVHGDHLVCPGPRRHRTTSWSVVTPRTGRAVYEAGEKGTTRVMNDKLTVVDRSQSKCQTLDRTRFKDGTDLTLYVRLMREPKVKHAHPFRIKWQLCPLGKGTTGGVSNTCADESAARLAFKEAVRTAISQGWRQVPMGHGDARAVEIKPIPAPKKRV